MLQINTGESSSYQMPAHVTQKASKGVWGHFAVDENGKLQITEETDGVSWATEVDPEEFYQQWMAQSCTVPYAYTKNEGLNRAENSISLVQGVTIPLKNGFQLQVKSGMVESSGDWKNQKAAEESADVASALHSLIKLANGQISDGIFYSLKNSSDNAKIGLLAAGIDVAKPFTINDKTFYYDAQGRIRTVRKS